MEPFGERVADFRAGQICATVANYAGKTRKADVEVATPGEFMPALAGDRPKAADPVLLDNAEAQSRLIMSAIFKKDS